MSLSEEQCRPQSQTARKPVLRSVPISLGMAGALRAWGGGGAWHSVRGGAPSGFATQARQGVKAALGVGHDNGGGDALLPVRLELGRCPALLSGAVRGPLGQSVWSARVALRLIKPPNGWAPCRVELPC